MIIHRKSKQNFRTAHAPNCKDLNPFAFRYLTMALAIEYTSSNKIIIIIYLYKYITVFAQEKKILTDKQGRGGRILDESKGT